MKTSTESTTRRRRALWQHLTVRLAAGLCLGATAILFAAGAWNLRLQRRHLTQVVGTSAKWCAEVIRSSTREAMLRNHPDDLKRIIETIARQDAIERIRVFDKQGQIKTSTRPEEIGTLVDTDAEQCFACHQRDEPLDRLDRSDRTRVFRGSGGEKILGVISPIRNEPACSDAACHAHSDSQTVLGVLDVQLPLGPVDADLAASENQMILGLIVTVVAVLLLAGLLTWRTVLRPVRRLTRAASQVAEGDLSKRVPVTSSDEIGEMTEAWNKMVGELNRARDQLEDWGHTLEKRVEEKTRELEGAHQRMLLVEKMASLGKLAATVAHEINNPLTGISTYARLLRRKALGKGSTRPDTTDETHKESERVLKLIEEESTRCGNIVRNLLLFSRTPAARYTKQDIQPLLERCVLLLKHQAELQDVRLRMKVESGLPHLSCDASQFQQMILALAMNGLEATPAGGEVTVSAREIDSGMVLEVSDSGRGIAPENLDQIFEPFFTTKEATTGVGLGLAVVYGIVSRHHGTIDVNSTPGSGTAFTIRLPLDQPPVPESPNADLEEVTP